MISKVTMYRKRNEQDDDAAEVCQTSTMSSTRKGAVGRRGGTFGTGKPWEFLKIDRRLDSMTKNPQACPEESPRVTIHNGN